MAPPVLSSDCFKIPIKNCIIGTDGKWQVAEHNFNMVDPPYFSFWVIGIL